MQKSLAIGLTILGVVLLTLGVIAYDSAGSSISQFFRDRPTDKTVWLLLGGVVALVAGLGGLARPAK
ncbi:MAG: DUF3185 family protein [Planctomycetes bacterium]|nr:DUF3185 family protein [Planctomycetota bacterium]